MHFTRPRELVIAAVIGLALTYLLFEIAYASIPRLPTMAGVTLLVLAIVETLLGFTLRDRIRSGKVLGGISFARAVALAKASSLLGALMLGAWLAALGYLVPRADRITAASDDLPAAAVGAGCAAALVAAALWLEYCCRTPEPRDRDRPPRVTG
ncbi:Protein of unknown function [Amycolatopsis marina]|uniref:DUF3180 domain-containing protein n=1 Tax=Amycolatopsis marina TaxID=490629 RepID=A0A1I0Y9L3_9PSEU|nr:DUF3180 domain-containing protein [Amycolatopsis marina]SFB08863.1 Protein of unknown function [Amycolatopsis marina]